MKKHTLAAALVAVAMAAAMTACSAVSSGGTLSDIASSIMSSAAASSEHSPLTSSGESSSSTSSSITSAISSSSASSENAKPASSAAASSSSPPPVSSETSAASDYSVSASGDIESRCFTMVNELRDSLGIYPLSLNQALAKAAYVRSAEMLESGLFDHTRPDGSAYYTAIEQAGYSYLSCSENIGTASGIDNTVDVAKTLFDAWKQSPSHYQNMISEKYVDIGISFCIDGNIAYATQCFGIQIE